MLIVALLLIAGGARPTAAQSTESAGADTATAATHTAEPLFEDVTAAAGLADNRRGDDRAVGQAWGDYDNDGWVDLYVTDTDGPNTLYRNLGDGTFAVAPVAADVALPAAYSGGAVFADYDNDGWRDLYVLNWGENVLFRNEQGERFVDVTATAGVGDPANGQTASWGDYDQDGYLDLYVANWACYPRCGRPMTGDIDRLYHNNGDGTFTDVTRALGTGVNGAGFVASFIDYDNDGDLDIYLVNDEFINPIGNKLWRNDGPGCDHWCFVEIAGDANADTRAMGMGLATADYDNDGDLDFYFSNAGPMTLLQNVGDGTYRDVAEFAGVQVPGKIGWGAVFFDYNNDGWEDLYLAVMDGSTDTAENPLFRNEGNGVFTPITDGSGVASDDRTLGVAYADYDRDGWVDLVIGNIDTGYALYRNLGGESADANWLAVDLVGGHGINRDAIGSRVTIITDDGRTLLKEVVAGSSLGAGNELTLHFGLGDARADALIVRWPDGTRQMIQNVPLDRRLTLTYGASPLQTFGAVYGWAPIGFLAATALVFGAIALTWRAEPPRGSGHKEEPRGG